MNPQTTSQATTSNDRTATADRRNRAAPARMDSDRPSVPHCFEVSELLERKVWTLNGGERDLFDIVFDDRTLAVRYFVVNLGSSIAPEPVYVLPHDVLRVHTEPGAPLPLRLSAAQLADAPRVDMAPPESRRVEIESFERSGWKYWLQCATTHYAGWMGMRIGSRVGAKGRRGGEPLRSARELIGYAVRAVDGSVGRVVDVLLEDGEWRVLYLVVRNQGVLGNDVRIEPIWISDVDCRTRSIDLTLSRERVETATVYQGSSSVDPRVTLETRRAMAPIARYRRGRE